MKTCAMGFLLIALAVPVNAAVIHNEAVNGDLSTDPNAPTALAFPVGSSTVTGITGNTTGAVDRDYITFTIPAGSTLVGLNLLALSPNNIAFTSFNAGATSFVPSAATAASFLAGIHINAVQIGTNLMPLFVSDSVTGNSLSSPDLGPGTYCFLIQQTNAILQSYSLEFVVSGPVPTADKTWGAIKSLYR
jgi:hypothetical protein